MGGAQAALAASCNKMVMNLGAATVVQVLQEMLYVFTARSIV